MFIIIKKSSSLFLEKNIIISVNGRFCLTLHWHCHGNIHKEITFSVVLIIIFIIMIIIPLIGNMWRCWSDDKDPNWAFIQSITQLSYGILHPSLPPISLPPLPNSHNAYSSSQMASWSSEQEWICFHVFVTCYSEVSVIKSGSLIVEKLQIP